MDVQARRLKKRREAERLRDLSPARTLAMGFSLSNFGRDLSAAASHARD